MVSPEGIGDNRPHFNENEIRILQLLATGASDRAIAKEIHLSFNTVRWYNREIYSKLGVDNRTAAVYEARRLGILDDEPDTPAVDTLSMADTPTEDTQPVTQPIQEETPTHELDFTNRIPRWLWLVVMLGIIGLLVGIILLANLALEPDIPPLIPYELEAGVVWQFDETAVDLQQVNLAIDALGSEGFVAIFPCNQSSEYHTRLTREIVDELNFHGLDYKIYNADSDAYEQLVLLEESIIENARAYIICSLDSTVLQETLEEIALRNIPLVSISDSWENYQGTKLGSPQANTQIGLAIGQHAGRVIQEELGGQAKVLVLDFPDLDFIIERADAMVDGLLEEAPQAEIVGNYLGATVEFAQTSIEEVLAEELAFDVILSINDAGSIGAVRALEDAEIDPGDVLIFSVDAEQQARNYVRDGHYFRGTVELVTSRMRTAVASTHILIHMLAGSTIPEWVDLGVGDVVTAENVDVLGE